MRRFRSFNHSTCKTVLNLQLLPVFCHCSNTVNIYQCTLYVNHSGMSRIDEGGTQMAKLRWLTASQAIKCKCPAYNGLMSNSAASTNTFATDTVTVIRSDAASQFPCASLPVTQRLSEWPIGGGGWQIPMLNAHVVCILIRQCPMYVRRYD